MGSGKWIPHTRADHTGTLEGGAAVLAGPGVRDGLNADPRGEHECSHIPCSPPLSPHESGWRRDLSLMTRTSRLATPPNSLQIRQSKVRRGHLELCSAKRGRWRAYVAQEGVTGPATDDLYKVIWNTRRC